MVRPRPQPGDRANRVARHLNPSLGPGLDVLEGGVVVGGVHREKVLQALIVGTLDSDVGWFLPAWPR